MSVTFHYILNCPFYHSIFHNEYPKRFKVISHCSFNLQSPDYDWLCEHFPHTCWTFLCLCSWNAYLVLLLIFALCFWFPSKWLSFLHVPDINPKSDMSLQIFSHILDCLFTLLVYFILKKVFALQPWILSYNLVQEGEGSGTFCLAQWFSLVFKASDSTTDISFSVLSSVLQHSHCGYTRVNGIFYLRICGPSN
jgi:hypothetical protein